MMNSALLPARDCLYKLWERSINVANGGKATAVPGSEWQEQVYYLSCFGRSGDEALRYLFAHQPPFDAFMDWVALTFQPVQEEWDAEPVLTKEELEKWDRDGYIIVRNAVSPSQCSAASNAIWEYLDADPGNEESWYSDHPGKQGMMLDLFQHPALTGNRRTPKIRKIYEELYGETACYLLIDKVSFNVPETDVYKFRGSDLHWDASLQLPIPFVLQGLLYLNDVSADDGAFHCVPGFHKQIDSWINSLPAGTDPRKEPLEKLKPVAVPGKAGDLVIWHQALPHCATPNRGKSPRMVQYIAYKPIKMITANVWK